MKIATQILLIYLIIVLAAFSLPAREKTVGLITYDQTQAWEGYTLFAPKHFHTTYLMNNAGQILNFWEKSTFEPGQSVYLLENGTLLRCCFDKGTGSTGGGEGGRIEAYDWDDNLIWELNFATNDYMSHHDIEPLPNGNILLLVVEKKTYQEALTAGFNPSNLHPDIQQKNYMLPDYVVEIEPTLPAGGKIVWEWHAWDHLIQDFNHNRNNYGNPAAHPELIDPNGAGGKVAAFWNHINSIDYNPELDQIMLSVRGNSELWVIDHSTATTEAAGHSGGRYGKGGDLLYRWGNPATYGRGDVQQLFQQHDTQWIEPGRPGAGNILVFNNGLKRSDGDWSSVDELVPPVDENGFYSLADGSAFGSENLLWTYYPENKADLYSEAISGAQRLPNGNTLICDGTHGRLFEVTPAGEVVWDYINPVVKEGPLNQGELPTLDDRGHQYNAVFKIHRYPIDYPAFDGKDLTPQGTVELYPSGVNTAMGDLPGTFELSQNYPNPFNPETTIPFRLAESGRVKLVIYDVRGREIKTLIHAETAAGAHTVVWDGTNRAGEPVSSGIYFCRLTVRENVVTRKMTLMR